MRTAESSSAEWCTGGLLSRERSAATAALADVGDGSFIDAIRACIARLPAEAGPNGGALAGGILLSVFVPFLTVDKTAALVRTLASSGALAGADGRALVSALEDWNQCCADSRRPRPATRDDSRVAIVLTLVERDYQRVSLDSMAQVLRCSRWHVSRLIRRETGFTFSDLVHRARVKEAQRLLNSTFLSVKEIAAAVGYSSTSQLDRRYKREFGQPPCLQRKAHTDSRGQPAAVNK